MSLFLLSSPIKKFRYQFTRFYFMYVYGVPRKFRACGVVDVYYAADDSPRGSRLNSRVVKRKKKKKTRSESLVSCYVTAVLLCVYIYIYARTAIVDEFGVYGNFVAIRDNKKSVRSFFFAILSNYKL